MMTYLFKGSELELEQSATKWRPSKKIRTVKDTKHPDPIEIGDSPVAKKPPPPSGRTNFLVIVSLALSLFAYHK